MENVKAVIKKAKINVAVMGNKAFKDAKKANPELHHMSTEGKALLCSFDQRKAEAVKFAPFIKVNDAAEQEPAITKGDVVKWFEQEGLSLTINDFSKMLKGTRAEAQERTKGGKGGGGAQGNTVVTPAPVSSASTNNLFTAQEGFLFNALLNEAAKLPEDEARGVRKELLQRLTTSLGDAALHNARREAMRGYEKEIEAEAERKRKELEEEAERKRNELADSFDSLIAEVISTEGLQEKESDDDFLTRMKELITANEDVEHPDLDRLLDLKGKGNTFAAELVETFETSPEKPEGAK